MVNSCESIKTISLARTESKGLVSITAQDLASRNYGALKWAVEGLIPEGLTIFGGSPKLGKSWLCLDLCLAIGSGNKAFKLFPTTQGKCLYLSLEDSERRLHDRINMLWGKKKLPEDSLFATAIEPMEEGGAEVLSAWIEANPTTRLVIIDTMEKFMPSKEHSPSYREDVERMSRLKRIADAYRVPMFLVHHTKKGTEADFIHGLSGTTGLTGTADNVMAFRRARGETDAVLDVTGREMPETSFCLNFFDDEGWVCEGNAILQEINLERKRILEALNSEYPNPMSPMEITAVIGSRGCGVSDSSVKRLLSKMQDDGLVKRVGHGKYTMTARVARDMFRDF